MVSFLSFLAFHFCRFCVVIHFFIPTLTANDLRLQRISIPDFIDYIFIISPVFPFLMLSAKQGKYWYHCYNVLGITRSLTGDWTRGQHSTLRLYYNAVLYNADTITTRSPRGSHIFFQYTMCENVSRRSQYTQCKLWNSYYLCIS